MKRRILFVDDEPRVLQGLQRMLRSMRHEWQMAFAGGGKEALEVLSREPFDVVVSDMRMPAMDGAELLAEVRRRHPEIVRIVLSGHSEKELILKSVLPAHQYLSKPCDPEVLKSAVGRASALRDLLRGDRLKQVVSQMDSLPSLPSLYAEIVEALHSPDTSIQEVGEIISKDVGMTAKILQLVNSAFFGLCQHVSSPVQAATLLGLETMKALVLSVQIFSEFDRSALSGPSLESLREHSIMTGVIAKAIAREEQPGEAAVDDAFMAGMLHDTGKLVLAAKFPQEYRQTTARAQEKGIPIHRAELEIFGTTHSEVGAYLMGLWGLPDSIVEALAFHHEPHRCPEVGFSPLTAVHTGNVLDHERSLAGTGEPLSRIDSDYLKDGGMIERLPVWRTAGLEAAEKGENDDG
ncbi:MAG: HDOD domain-containing protein [Deltaproteobacteria bacterium]|nr:HDOD domain-containing protein [Deltaproteobacteria bacterium]